MPRPATAMINSTLQDKCWPLSFSWAVGTGCFALSVDLNPSISSNREKALQEKHDAGKKPEKKKETLPESVASLAEVLVSGLFIITFVVQSFVIPSASMESTLLIGDHLFVDRLAPSAKASYTGPIVPYRQVHRGATVVF